MSTYFGANCHDNGGKNTGIRATFVAPSPATQFLAARGIWISQYTSPKPDGNSFWGQVGFTGENKAFYQVFAGSTLIKTSKVTGKTARPISLGDHTFEISVSSGTKWHFLVDGRSQGTYDMKAIDAPSSNILAVGEDGDGSRQIYFKDIMLRRNGVWVPVQVGTAEVLTGQFNAAPVGVYGNLQDATVPINAVRIGGSSNVSHGTQLW